MKNLKKILFFSLIMGLIFVSFSCKKDKKEANLIASGHKEWRPVMFQSGEEIIGAGPEITKKIFGELGVTVVCPYEGPWDVVQEKTKEGTIDVIVAAYKTEEREKYMAYSVPYTVDPVILVVKKGNPFVYNEWQDLIGKNGVLMTGDSYGQEFDNFILANLTTVRVGTPGEAISLLANGQADYFVYALYSAESYISQNNLSNQVEIIPKYIVTENFHLTISKKSSFLYLLPQVDSLLLKYKNDGTIDSLINKYKLK